MDRHCIEAVDKTIRYTVLPGANLRMNGKFVVQIKNNFHYAFGFDKFFMKRHEPLDLPDSADNIAEMRCLRYVKTAVQMDK